MADRADFEALVEHELSHLRAYARVLARDGHDAEDLLQDALVKLAGVWPRLDPERNLAAYARTIVTRLAVDRHRRRAVERRFLERVRRQAVTPVAEPELSGLDPWLAAALAQLSPRQRAAVVLTHGYDLSVDDVAAHLGCGTATAKTHLARGLAALRALPRPTPLEGVD